MCLFLCFCDPGQVLMCLVFVEGFALVQSAHRTGHILLLKMYHESTFCKIVPFAEYTRILLIYSLDPRELLGI